MTISAIKKEIADNPLGRDYSGTDQEVADSLNVKDRSRNLAELTGDAVFDATDATQFAALVDHKQDLWLSFCSRGIINPFGSANVAFVQWVFGGGSATVQALAALRVESISRGEEIGHGFVRVGAVTQARM